MDCDVDGTDAVGRENDDTFVIFEAAEKDYESVSAAFASQAWDGKEGLPETSAFRWASPVPTRSSRKMSASSL